MFEDGLPKPPPKKEEPPPPPPPPPEEDPPVEEEEEGFGVMQPIVPFSALFILSPTNP